MKDYVCVWKPVGLTPLQLVEEFKEKNPEQKEKVISYAGRLDPMAEGILVLLIGDENKNRDKYLNLDKKYETEILFGVSTDTFDSLGLIAKNNLKEVSRREIENSIEKFSGKLKQKYPPYSSKAVDGKPLYWWARKNKLNEIEVPKREIEIYSIELIDFDKVSINKTIDEIIQNIKMVHGDFRQDEIIKIWIDFQEKNVDQEFVKVKLEVDCSSGTYIRRLADDLGKDLGTFAFANKIRRIRVGDITEKQCIII